MTPARLWLSSKSRSGGGSAGCDKPVQRPPVSAPARNFREVRLWIVDKPHVPLGMAPSEQEVDAPVMEQQGPEDAEDDLLWAQAFQQELDESLRMELENTLGDQEDAPAVVEAERYQEEEENLLHTPEELWLPGGLRVEEWLADPTPAAVLPRDEASEMGLRLLRARGTVWFTVGGTMLPRVQAIA